MCDTRRRRKQSGGSDDLSDCYEQSNATKDIQHQHQQNSQRTDDLHDSIYDSAASDVDSEAGSQDGGERESGDGQEEDKPQRKLDDDEDRRNPQYIPKRGTFYEHDDRTTEETPDSTSEPPPERDTKEKKVWKDREDRWQHDRYNDDEQTPKSHEELVAVYGYDIRNEEGPPRARRRRRYGRGPNKYTRNWEDEDAYGKTAASVTTAKNPGKRINKTGEEFPALGGGDAGGEGDNGNKDTSGDLGDEPVITSAWYSNKNKTQNKPQNFPPLQTQRENHGRKSGGSSENTHANENRAPNEPTNPAWKRDTRSTTSRSPRRSSPNRNVGGGGGGGGDSRPSPRDTKKRQVQESVSLAASKMRGRGIKAGVVNNPVANRATTDLRVKGRGAAPVSADPRDHHHQPLANAAETKQSTVNDGSYRNTTRQNKYHYVPETYPGYQKVMTVAPRLQQQQQQPPQPPPQPQPPQQQQQQQQQQVPPQVHSQQTDVAGNRPKRYSSLRQRPAIPEGPGQPQQAPYASQHAQHGFYPPQAGNSHGVLESQGFGQAHYDQPTPVGNSGAPLPGPPVVPLAPAGQSTAYAPPPFLVPPPFIAPQTAPPNIINYVPTTAGAAFQPNFQGYQGYTPTVPGPTPPAELFQPQGCTYYNPAQQQQQQQQGGVPILRRPKAIPIVPPPDANSQYHQCSRGRGRPTRHTHSGVVGKMAMVPQHQQQQPSMVEDEIRVGAEMYENARFKQSQESLRRPHPSESSESQEVQLELDSTNLPVYPTETMETATVAVTEELAASPETLARLEDAKEIPSEETHERFQSEPVSPSTVEHVVTPAAETVATPTAEHVATPATEPVATLTVEPVDSPRVEAVTATPAAETVAADPTAETVAAAPAAEAVVAASAAEPVAAAPAVEPVAATPSAEPVATTPAAEPVDAVPTVELVAAVPAVEPVAVTPAVEPVATTPAVEPVTTTPAAQAAAAVPAAEPVAPTLASEPVAAAPVVEPVAAAPTAEPIAAEPVVAAPTVETIVIPTAEPVTTPATEVVTNLVTDAVAEPTAAHVAGSASALTPERVAPVTETVTKTETTPESVTEPVAETALESATKVATELTAETAVVLEVTAKIELSTDKSGSDETVKIEEPSQIEAEVTRTENSVPSEKPVVEQAIA